MKIIGLTATPYRQDQGMLHEDCVKGKAIFTKMAYETNIPDLIKQGYLSHVESISGEVEADMTDVKMKGQDYDTELAAVKFDAIVVDAVIDMKVKFAAYGINTAIVYASNLANARRIIAEWGESANIRLAYGEMSTHDRNALTAWLREGNGLRVVVNVGLFVTGFDYRALDCVVFFVATKSLVKYVQIAGRVIRSHEEKELGYVLDYGGNIERHGPIDATIPPKNKKRKDEAPKKPCLECGEANSLNAKRCKECGAEFISEGTEGNYSMRTKAQALALKQHHRHEITSVLWESAFSRKSSLPMIKGLFYEDNELVYTHYLCLDHPGFAAENSKRFLMSMFKDKKDYFLLGKTHINCKSILTLLNDAPKFFKTIKAIEIHDQEDSRFKKLEKVIYE
jgi:DNA repair protein RadD